MSEKMSVEQAFGHLTGLVHNYGEPVDEQALATLRAELEGKGCKENATPMDEIAKYNLDADAQITARMLGAYAKVTELVDAGREYFFALDNGQEEMPHETRLRAALAAFSEVPREGE